MPKVTREEAIEFIKIHLNYDETQEQKLSEADATVQKFLKTVKPDTHKLVIELADSFVEEFGKEISEKKFKSLIDKTVKEFYNQLLKSSSFTSIAVLGCGGGLFGRVLAGGGLIGIIAAALGALTGSLIGALCADKPDPVVVLSSLKLARELLGRYPESKELIAQAFGNALFNHCYYWANTYGGFAQGIHMTVELKSLTEGAKTLLTPSLLKAAG